MSVHIYIYGIEFPEYIYPSLWHCYSMICVMHVSSRSICPPLDMVFYVRTSEIDGNPYVWFYQRLKLKTLWAEEECAFKFFLRILFWFIRLVSILFPSNSQGRWVENREFHRLFKILPRKQMSLGWQKSAF